MKLNRKAGGFTLIELLVVVLIIGILSAVALPQYQKAVEHSRAVEALVILKAVHTANENYYLAQGEYATKLSQLDIDISWKGNTAYLASNSDTRSNENWSLQFTKNSTTTVITLSRIDGKYRGSGFMVTYESLINRPTHQLLCFERVSSADALFAFDNSLGAGAYCEKIIHGNFVTGSDTRWNRVYSLP